MPASVAGLGPDTLGIVVATDGLRVRGLPTVGDESERLEPTLPEGVRLYVVDGPVAANGYAWYQVSPYGDPLERVGPTGDWTQVGVEVERRLLPFGWVAAASRTGEPWIEGFPLGCDTVAPSAESLVSGEPLEHLFCSLAGETPRTIPPGPDIAVEGTLSCSLADDHWGPLSGPSWIDQRGECALQTTAGRMRVSGRPISALLDGVGSAVEGRYAIVGHFDDAEASECQSGGFEGAAARHPAQDVLDCRAEFVATTVTLLGGIP